MAQGVIAVEAGWVLFALLGGDPRVIHGADYRLYEAAAARWLAGGPFFNPAQVAGPYSVWHVAGGAVLYPPVILWLLVPFTVLPALLWWAIPCAIIVWSVRRVGPAWWAWPVLLLIAVVPDTPTVFLSGNPAMWALAALSLGAVLRWPSVFVLLKPSLFPFALLGAWDRRWWLALVAGVVACLPFGPMWLDYVRVVGNAGGSLGYSLGEVPLMCAPLVVWAGHFLSQRERSPSTAAEPSGGSASARRAG